MGYYYDSVNDFYVIKITNKLTHSEYMKILKYIIQNEKRGDIKVYYTTLADNFEYVILDFSDRKLTTEDVHNLLTTKGRGK